jgi:hypothetical protein
MRALARIEYERNVIRVQAVRTLRDERAERMIGHQPMQGLGAILFEIGGEIHRRLAG